MTNQTESRNLEQIIRTTLIRDLVEQYPSTLPVLNSYGMDTCCGGGFTPVEAAKAHGEDADRLINDLVVSVRAEVA
jgi:iron-sulfur cluster repair protein YtfE (RIC family)